MPRIRKNENKSITNQSAEPFWKIGLYLRLSKEDENEDESESIINQEKILRSFVADYFEEGAYEIIHVFSDDGNTGTDMLRPEFQRMQNSIIAKEVNCIIIKSLSRAFRNSADQTKFLEEFIPRHRVRFINVVNPKFIDTLLDPRAIYGLDVAIHGMFNEKYAEAISVEVRNSFDNKRRAGDFIGSFAPYGYAKDPLDKNKLIIDEHAAQVVQSIFQWFVNDGYSKNGIAKKLNQMGEPNPTQYKKDIGKKYRNPNFNKNDGLWSATTVSRILQNPVYIGTMVQGKTSRINYKVHDPIPVSQEAWFVVPNTHEAIIDEKLFENAQELHKKDTRTSSESKQVHMFSGLLRCADCEKALRRKSSRGFTYFSCRTYTDKNVCSKHSIRKDKLEHAVLKTLQIQISLADKLLGEIEQINSAPVVRHESVRLNHALTQAEKKHANYSNASDSLYLDWKNGDISKDEYHRLKSDYANQIKQVEESIEQLQKEIQIMHNGISLDDPYLTSFLKYRNIQSLSRGILVELIDTIWLDENGGITIDFKFDDHYQRIMEYIENNRKNLVLLEGKAVG